MALDLTPVEAAEMRVSRLSLPDEAEFRLQYLDEEEREYADLLTLDQSGVYDWEAVNIDNLAVAKDFTRLRIVDFEGLRTIIQQTELVTYGEYRFKVSRVDPPFGVVRIWTLKLERSEEINPQ